jgi:capsular polysaccharide transport system permease protein
MSLEIGHDPSDRLGRAIDVGKAVSLSEKGMLARLFGLFFTKRNSFLVFVLVPSVVAAVYYSLIASGQYVAEMRMIVRTIGVSERFDTSEKREGRSMIGGDSLTQDSYIVANYLKSPEIVKKLDAELGLREFFSRNDRDWLSRLPKDATFETFFRYWVRQVDTYVDGPSGIIIFTVRAFSPEDSVRIANAGLAAANGMIDKISEKAKRDLVARVEGDVNASLDSYRVALDDLRDYQNKTGILDPLSSAKMLSEIIGKLTEQKLQLIVSLKSLEAANADNTARGRELRRSIDAIDEQIALRQNSLAGTKTDDNTQLSGSLTEFSRLETRRIVAQAIYEANVRNLDTAKSTALKRTTFMSIFSSANLPEESEYPNRLTSWIIFTIGLLTLWMTATLIWMSIEDHRV